MEPRELNDMISFINGLLKDKYRYISTVCKRMTSKASKDDLELRICFSAECAEYIKLTELLIRYMREMIERSDNQIQQINTILSNI
jgi:hypothetical protein